MVKISWGSLSQAFGPFDGECSMRERFSDDGKNDVRKMFLRRYPMDAKFGSLRSHSNVLSSPMILCQHTFICKTFVGLSRL